jgi:hypothetical protein
MRAEIPAPPSLSDHPAMLAAHSRQRAALSPPASGNAVLDQSRRDCMPSHVEVRAPPVSRRSDLPATSGGSTGPRSRMHLDSHRVKLGSAMLHPVPPAPYMTAPLSTPSSRRSSSEILTSKPAGHTTSPSGEPAPLECMDCWTPSVHHHTDMPTTPGGSPCPHLWAHNEPRVRYDSPRVASGRDILSLVQPDVYPVVETVASEQSVRSIELRARAKALTIGRVSSADLSS